MPVTKESRGAAWPASSVETSPPYKRVEALDHVPAYSGPLGALSYLVFLPLMWASLLLILFRGFISSPFGFLRRQRRSFRPEGVPLPHQLAGLVHEMIDVGDGVRLHAVSFGRRPDLPLMLFLHGFPECWYSWRYQLLELREQYEVVAVDTRGAGWSDKPLSISAYSLERLSADVAAVVSALGRRSCTLVAHDWGALAAWVAAGRYPGLVERLVVMAGPHLLLFKRNLTASQLLKSSYVLMFQMPVCAELLLTYNDAALLDRMWLARSSPAGPRTPGAFSPADVEVYKAALLQPGAATATLNYYRALLAADAGLLPFDREVERALRRELDMPVLVVWGGDDHALGTPLLGGVAQVAPRSEVHILPNCSHWIQSDAPGELSRVLKEWLEAYPLQAPAKK